jgi:hypothetical protein
MAFSHVYFNDQLPAGRRLRSLLNKAEESDDAMADEVGTFVRMCEGDDPSQEANFAEVTARYGFTSNAKAKAAYDELASAYSKISGNGSVTDVRAARDQLFAKLRG